MLPKSRLPRNRGTSGSASACSYFFTQNAGFIDWDPGVFEGRLGRSGDNCQRGKAYVNRSINKTTTVSPFLPRTWGGMEIQNRMKDNRPTCDRRGP